MGQLRWWRKGQKAVTQMTWFALPQASAVDKPYRFDKIKNTIEGNRNTDEHVDYIFNHVISELGHPEAKVDVIGVSEGAMGVSRFFEQPANWEKWESRVQAFAAVATWFQSTDCKNPKFLEWMLARSRAYTLSDEPAGTFLMGPEGNKRSFGHGSPEVAAVDEAKDGGNGVGYRNPVFFRQDDDDDDYTDPGFGDEGFGDEERSDGIELKIEDGTALREEQDK
ncbi:arb2 domain-containing protein [Rutstroemia sp. NJR-2017a BBW]|nr:arb2 domain-containing protein [Rutstroemia sp. NJR-2017a BBW]